MDFEQIAKDAILGRYGITKNTPMQISDSDKFSLVKFMSPTLGTSMKNSDIVTVMIDKETGKVKHIIIGA